MPKVQIIFREIPITPVTSWCLQQLTINPPLSPDLIPQVNLQKISWIKARTERTALLQTFSFHQTGDDSQLKLVTGYSDFSTGEECCFDSMD